MTRRVGSAGRRARDLALGIMGIRTGDGGRAVARFPVRRGSLPLLQRAVSGRQAVGSGESVSSPSLALTAAAEIEQEMSPPSPEEVADRVYRLFCQDLRRDRERRGAPW